MRWIASETEFKDILTLAKECLNEQPGTQLVCGVFDSAEVRRKVFLVLLQSLMKLAGDHGCYFIVLEPDPLTYFHFHFKRYPSIEIDIGDTASAYLGALNEDPGASPADAIGINWSKYVVVPKSEKWFVSAHRDDETNQGGRLYIPAVWRHLVAETYPGIEFGELPRES